MNLEEIIALLKQKFTGVRSDGLTALARSLAIQYATIDDVKSAIEKITDAQVTNFVKDFRADIDREVTNSNRAYEDGLRKKYDFVEKKVTEPGGGDPNQNQNQPDVAAIVAAAVKQAIEPLTSKIQGFEQKNIAETRLSQLKAKLAECKDEMFKAQALKDFARMTFADDAAFAEYLNEKATDIAAANQTFADNQMRMSGGGSPSFGSKDNEGVSSAVAAFVKEQNPENNQFTGKEV